MKKEKLLFVPLVEKTSACRQKEGLKQIKKLPLLPRLTAVLPPQGREMIRGFTLIELLVVVLIIGILAAVAVPQYQRAVMKSRYSALMPIAKSIAKGNEVYYMEHGNYASQPQSLVVEGQSQYAAGTKLQLGADINHAYVLAGTPEELPKNTYIIYQDHSINYPGEVHCEALKNNAQAAAVCKSFGATENKGPILSSTHDTWLLKGNGDGFPPGYSALLASVSCDKAEGMGYSCASTVNEDGTATKRVCQYIEGSGKELCTMVYFDENGKKTKSAKCTMQNNGVCWAENESFYDNRGNLLSVLRCYGSSGHNKDGSCKTYNCGGDCYVYTYDEDDNRTTRQTCAGVTPEDPTHCSSYYTYGAQMGYVYEDGLLKRQTRCTNGGSVDAEGKCSNGYDPFYTFVYEYDEDDRITKKTLCSGFDENDACIRNGSPYNYTYDSEGNVLEVQQGYGNGNQYTYDAQGNKTSQRSCDRVSNGVCTAYRSGGTGYYWEYDSNGNVTSYSRCQLNTDGTCSTYQWRYNNTYDDAGNHMSTTDCSGSRLNSETGECVGDVFGTNGYLTPQS